MREFEIDGFLVGSTRSVDSAADAFGVPSSRQRDGYYCRLTWERLGIQVIVSSGAGRNPCLQGQFAGAVATGERWRTSEGLRVGDALAELRVRHPKARQRPDGWWWLTVTRRRVAGRLRPQPTLMAHVRGGRVDSIVVA